MRHLFQFGAPGERPQCGVGCGVRTTQKRTAPHCTSHHVSSLCSARRTLLRHHSRPASCLAIYVCTCNFAFRCSKPCAKGSRGHWVGVGTSRLHSKLATHMHMHMHMHVHMHVAHARGTCTWHMHVAHVKWSSPCPCPRLHPSIHVGRQHGVHRRIACWRKGRELSGRGRGRPVDCERRGTSRPPPRERKPSRPTHRWQRRHRTKLERRGYGVLALARRSAMPSSQRGAWPPSSSISVSSAARSAWSQTSVVIVAVWPWRPMCFIRFV